MSFFRRKDQNQIPPVAPSGGGGSGNSSSPRPSNRSNANTYVPSRDGDLSGSYDTSSYKYTQQGPPAPIPDSDPYSSTARRYGQSTGRSSGAVGDVYSRGAAASATSGPVDLDRDRNELFSGYNPEKAGSGRFFDGPSTGARPPPREGEETEEDVEAIKKDIRWVKQESVNSTRNALRLAQEAEETGRNTLLRLGDQSEKLANTERHLDVSKGHNARAADHAGELKQLNRSIFRPVITFNKESKRAAQESKIQQRYEDEREEREKAMVDVRESQNRIGRAAGYGRDDGDDGFNGGGPQPRGQRSAQQVEQRKRFQFEKSTSDDEMEDELDGNLDEISAATKRLKALGMAMGQELDSQNVRIDRLGQKVDKVDNDLNITTGRLQRYGGK
ncbi:hypothetical protein BDN72DRAFT_954882 [Pluteus cervinus]|uniref:Uncharacterized protein n=1 Tax=Pluteus cervinus TaxID=181527 RepID=A0ACD3BCC6_9AGAR|nr:hypothetical protein BDN72DRAFT_954882 [Pluteus cervinus]